VTVAEGLSSRDFEISDQALLVREPVVSALMLAYNHASYIAQAIESVVSQETSFPFELLIGEDCSTDDTRAIALEYQRRYPDLIRVITSEANVGVGHNWRRLLIAGRGDFLAHLDGDDFWLPGKLEQQLAFLRHNPGCVAVYTNAITVSDGGTRIGLFNDVGNAFFDLSAMLRRGNFLNTSSMLFRTELREGLLDIDGAFIDYRVHLRHARKGLLAQLEQPLVGYRVGSGASMVLKSNDMVRQLYWDAILDVPRQAVSKLDFAEGVADFLRRVCFRAVRARRWDLLMEWMPRAINSSPFGAVAMSFLVIESMLRIAWKEGVGRLLAKIDSRRLPVLYRR
jgi:glycosyltransferase involved in cell wall biosynthesis